MALIGALPLRKPGSLASPANSVVIFDAILNNKGKPVAGRFDYKTDYLENQGEPVDDHLDGVLFTDHALRVWEPEAEEDIGQVGSPD